MSRVKTSLDYKRIRRLIWLVLTVFVLLGYSLQSAAGNAYYSMVTQAYATVSSPPVILQNGTAGTSTIYTNRTSAKVSVSPAIQSEDLGSAVQVTSNGKNTATVYSTQRRLLRTTDADNTLHVFIIDSSDFIQWYRSKDNGKTFSQAFSSVLKAGSLSVARDNDNYIHLVYGWSGNVYYRKQAYDATSWGTQVTLASGNSYYASISLAPYNHSWIYVVYDNHKTTGAPVNKWYFRSSTDAGSSWSSPFEGTLNEYTGAFTVGTFPSIVIDNTLDTYGHIYVTWFRGETYLYLRRGKITSTGAATWDAGSNTISSGMSNATTTVNTNMMHSAVYTNGKYRVVYCESGTAKYRDWNESSWSTSISLASVSKYPSLTYNDNNYLYVFYETNATNSNYDIRYQKSSDTTPTAFDSAVNVTNNNLGNHYVNAKVGGHNQIEFVWTKGTFSPYGVQYNRITCTVEGDFDYVLKVINQGSYPWQIRLNVYSEFNRHRLNNCTIYFYNQTNGNSSQIIIINGSYTKRTGDLYYLAGGVNQTDFIAMHVEASGGTSYIYVYLEIFVPNKTTYARYIITFEIT